MKYLLYIMLTAGTGNAQVKDIARYDTMEACTASKAEVAKQVSEKEAMFFCVGSEMGRVTAPAKK